ncbi:hypothetical protein [Streptomyces sp. NBC_00385]|uniref:hypothetical protein n=1 Tax=Streptomyces sp. NBC_00385 TaxID=2975733 RepID=UPI002DDA698C|nr:hypothetical protein [Streptomyces sp. NBC_00385]
MPHDGVARRTVLAAGAATVAAVTTTIAHAPEAQAVPALPNGISKDKVLIVGMDGLRHDRIEAANAPHEFWSRTRRDQWRELNVRARGVFAVADSDEWSDKTFSGRFDSTLVSPVIGSLSGRSTLTIEFITHYRQVEQQTARVLVSFNAGTPSEVRSYATDVTSQEQSIEVPIPSGATSAHVRFHYTGDNDFFWVIDRFRLHAR